MIKYYRANTLENIARTVLSGYDQNYLNMPPQAVPIEQIIEKQYNLSIEYCYLTEKCAELGRMIYDDGFSTVFSMEKDDYELFKVKVGTMMIETRLTVDPSQNGRLRFTLAHELGHWILHKNLFTGTCTAAASLANEIDEDAIEWQANYLAQAILMPNGQVKRGFYGLYGIVNDNNKISEMAKIFAVSKQAMKIRLENLGLLKG